MVSRRFPLAVALAIALTASTLALPAAGAQADARVKPPEDPGVRERLVCFADEADAEQPSADDPLRDLGEDWEELLAAIHCATDTSPPTDRPNPFFVADCVVDAAASGGSLFACLDFA